MSIKIPALLINEDSSLIIVSVKYLPVTVNHLRFLREKWCLDVHLIGAYAKYTISLLGFFVCSNLDYALFFSKTFVNLSCTGSPASTS